jgi:hypothetical protein
MKELASFPGILRGAGREAACTVLTTQVSVPGTDGFAHSDYSVRNVSRDLPDGQYVLFANGSPPRLLVCGTASLKMNTRPRLAAET